MIISRACLCCGSLPYTNKLNNLHKQRNNLRGSNVLEQFSHINRALTWVSEVNDENGFPQDFLNNIHILFTHSVQIHYGRTIETNWNLQNAFSRTYLSASIASVGLCVCVLQFDFNENASSTHHSSSAKSVMMAVNVRNRQIIFTLTNQMTMIEYCSYALSLMFLAHSSFSLEYELNISICSVEIYLIPYVRLNTINFLSSNMRDFHCFAWPKKKKKEEREKWWIFVVSMLIFGGFDLLSNNKWP